MYSISPFKTSHQGPLQNLWEPFGPVAPAYFQACIQYTKYLCESMGSTYKLGDCWGERSTLHTSQFTTLYPGAPLSLCRLQQAYSISDTMALCKSQCGTCKILTNKENNKKCVLLWHIVALETLCTIWLWHTRVIVFENPWPTVLKTILLECWFSIIPIINFYRGHIAKIAYFNSTSHHFSPYKYNGKSIQVHGKYHHSMYLQTFLHSPVSRTNAWRVPTS